MSDFETLTAGLLINKETEKKEQPLEVEIENPFEIKPQQETIIEKQKPIQQPKKNSAVQNNNNTHNTSFFEPKAFQTELRNKSIKKNKSYHLYSENITALI